MCLTPSRGLLSSRMHKFKSQKKDFIWGSIVFKGYCSYKVDWEPNYKVSSHCPSCFPHWVTIVDLPTEYWNESIIEKIGNSLGRTIGIVEDFLLGSYGIAKILVELDMNFRNLDNLEILIENGRWFQKIIVESSSDKCVIYKSFVDSCSLSSRKYVDLSFRGFGISEGSDHSKDVGSGNTNLLNNTDLMNLDMEDGEIRDDD
ncbi:hypothetical protein SUGI_0816010 [Cryptomeria japonica]|nr:hypothetical protein SUGI_0816010 [Cryptomeria japonica]